MGLGINHAEDVSSTLPGTGPDKYGALPVPEERGIERVCQKMGEAIDTYTSMDGKDGEVLAIFHLNC